jgi:hypothetical protein
MYADVGTRMRLVPNQTNARAAVVPGPRGVARLTDTATHIWDS